MDFERIKQKYKEFLKNENLASSTIQTAMTDTFFLMRHGYDEEFWQFVKSSEIGEDAKRLIVNILRSSGNDNPETNANNYMYHLRNFSKFFKNLNDTKDEYIKFKRLIEWFVNQVNVNNGVVPGERHSGKGYKGHNIISFYRDYREYDGFTLDCSIEVGYNSATQSNYIHVTKTWVNIVPYFISKENKKEINELEIILKPEGIVKRVGSRVTIKEIGLFDGNEPNHRLKLFFDEYKKIALEFLNKNEEKKAGQKMANECELNTILYGPPGTGKTYHTVYHAVSIIEGISVDELKKEEYSQVLSRYNEYKTDGYIDFVTFHQSYGYEEFIEGIKPIVDERGEMTYQVRPGSFKKFCEKASRPVGSDIKTNSNPAVWKVSLAKAGDNPLRRACIESGQIRIRWDGYGEEITEDTEFNEGGKTSLKYFINEMRIGDIVVSCYNANIADAIGVITGAYEWHPEYEEYKRVRSVNWVAKGKFNIANINDGKAMTQSTVYKLNDIDLLKLYEYMKCEEIVNAENDKKYVFIIDEINRGNISKIFGEVITLIESAKRKNGKEEMQVTLPYSGSLFGVPKNVYIVGTMNTADRSIAMIDTALRRRFAFKEMMPDVDELRDIYIYDVSIADMLKRINEKIEILYDREHTIGHAYFMQLKDYSKRNVTELGKIFENKILPLLQEYFYDDYEKIQLILGDNNKDNDEEKFVVNVEKDYGQLFGNIDSDFDEKPIYRINRKAFYHIASYKRI